MNSWHIPKTRFPIEVTPRVHVLGNYFFNLTLVSGTELTLLFEAGVSAVVDEVIAQLDQLGMEPDIIVVSHPHSDHVTGLPGLADRFTKARIIAGMGAKAFMTHPKAAPALVAEDRFISRRLEELGITPGRPSLEAALDVSRIEEITSPARLDLGWGVFFDLMPAKGHSPGALMGFMQPDNVLCTSDALGFHYPGRDFWPLFFTGVTDYLDTLDQIRKLAPSVISPAHQGPILSDQVNQVLAQARSRALDIVDKIRDTQLSDQDLIKELFDTSYKEEFSLYTRENIMNCSGLLVKRAREFQPA